MTNVNWRLPYDQRIPIEWIYGHIIEINWAIIEDKLTLNMNILVLVGLG